jgi:hypothetical protein
MHADELERLIDFGEISVFEPRPTDTDSYNEYLHHAYPEDWKDWQHTMDVEAHEVDLQAKKMGPLQKKKLTM